MSRYFKVNVGRRTVRPLKIHDAKNMMILAQKTRDAATNEETRKRFDRDYLMIKLGVNTAFRIGDLLQMKVDENLLKGNIYLRENKTRKEQSFELNEKLHKDIIDYIKRNNLYEGEYLFQSRKGKNKPITRQNAWIRIKKYANAVGVKYLIGCHSLRKCFARTFYEQTKDIITLQKMLNHSSPQVTFIYICWDDDDQQKSRKEFYL